MLANRLVEKYRYQNCAVMALNDGGVIVGAQIAQQLHCSLTMLPNVEALLRREADADIVTGITDSGLLAFNRPYESGEIDELVAEHRTVIEEEKLRQIHDFNFLLGDGGTLSKSLLAHHNVIVVADGLQDGLSVDLAYEFLKPVSVEKLVIAVPLASLEAVDRMHVIADDLYCLTVVENYVDTDHYYDKHDVPDHKTVVETIEQIILKWQ